MSISPVGGSPPNISDIHGYSNSLPSNFSTLDDIVQTVNYTQSLSPHDVPTIALATDSSKNPEYTETAVGMFQAVAALYTAQGGEQLPSLNTYITQLQNAASQGGALPPLPPGLQNLSIIPSGMTDDQALCALVSNGATSPEGAIGSFDLMENLQGVAGPVSTALAPPFLAFDSLPANSNYQTMQQTFSLFSGVVGLGEKGGGTSSTIASTLNNLANFVMANQGLSPGITMTLLTSAIQKCSSLDQVNHFCSTFMPIFSAFSASAFSISSLPPSYQTSTFSNIVPSMIQSWMNNPSQITPDMVQSFTTLMMQMATNAPEDTSSDATNFTSAAQSLWQACTYMGPASLQSLQTLFSDLAGKGMTYLDSSNANNANAKGLVPILQGIVNYYQKATRGDQPNPIDDQSLANVINAITSDIPLIDTGAQSGESVGNSVLDMLENSIDLMSKYGASSVSKQVAAWLNDKSTNDQHFTSQDLQNWMTGPPQNWVL